MTSKEWFGILENHLNEKGFHVCNSSIGNGYFVFDMGNESVIHFDVKENRGWRFAVWFEFDKENKNNITKATFFTRHKDDLDKFKPSRSFYVKTYTIDPKSTLSDYKEWELCYVSDLCLQIKQHPIISYCVDNQNSYMGGYGFMCGNIIIEYMKSRLYYFIHRIKYWYKNSAVKCNLTWIKLQFTKKWLESDFKDCIKSVKIIDGCAGEWIIIPRFTMVITWDSTYDENKTFLEPIVYPFYHWSGKRKIGNNADIEWRYKDDRGRFSFVPTQEDIEQIYGWKYKLFSKIFK